MNVRLRAQIVKELLSIVRDPKSRLVLIVPPLLQLVVFSYAATLEVKNVDVAILDQDRGAAAIELVQRMEASWFVDEVIHVASMDDLERHVTEQKVLMALHLLPGFSADVAAGQPATAQLLLDGRRANAAQIASRYVGIVARDYGLDLAAQSRAPRVGGPEIVVRHWWNPNLAYVWFIVPSLSGILAMFTALLITALSIARERELGTFDQLLVSPATPTEIIIGKTVPALIVGTLLALVMIVAGIFIFRIPFTGSFWLLLACLILFISSVVGIGLMLSAICQTQQQAILGTFSIGIPTILVSGFATPVENMPHVLQLVAELSPLKHFLIIVQGSFLKALPPAEVLANAWPLAALAAMTFPAAILTVKRRLS